MIASVKFWAKRLGIILASLVPVACHSVFTGPMLWAHQSSAAFNWFVSLWLLAVALPIAAIMSTAKR